jgi:hypothetical protein
MRLLVAVDDPTAVQVVRRQLDLDAVTGEDADPIAPHLPCGVTERLVAAVESDPEISVPKRFDDLAVELDLLFLLGDYAPCGATLIASGPLAPSRDSYSTFCPSLRDLKPLPAMFE